MWSACLCGWYYPTVIYLQQLVSQRKCTLSWPYGVTLLKSLYPFGTFVGIHAVHPLASYVEQLWDAAEKRGGWAALHGRMFALWMTRDSGSWNGFPHTGFWCLCSLLLLHVAAALFSLDGDETEWDSAFSPPSAPPHPRVRCGTSH